ncbi:unnamed protein product [Lactuca virosa]|uniref:Uncharacterized protein n=1 Tax=Lactuca virosa TaxID=75947 RepID=A0AAU9MEX0_9ASTR|nr:unnamed protein product [Lactuca virosa]
MEKNNEKFHLEKRTLEQKLKGLKEKKSGQNGNVAFGSGKGNVKIVPEKEYDLKLKLSKEQLVEQAKRDIMFDELHALNTKIINEEVEQKNVESILAGKKAMFP